jgi:endonuclease/exonuclease/phosphatase (EEP) superfamily protein YafD
LSCKEPEGNPVFSILVMNVFMNNRNVEGAMKIIVKNQPDIIIAIETNHWWNNHLAVLKKDYPYYVLVPLENTYGMSLYSTMRLVNPEVKYLYQENVPSIHTEVLMKTGKSFRLYAVHPKPPAPGHSGTSTHRDAELLTIGKETRNIEGPIIVAGDLNDVAWSFTTNLFQRYSKLLDPRVGRGMFNTFNANSKLWRWPLDHIFHSDHFQLIDIKTLPKFGSDHFPIYVKLCYLSDKRHEQDEPQADEDDMKLANDKMSRAEPM